MAWKKTVWRIVFLAPVAILALLAAVYLAIHVPPVDRFVLSKTLPLAEAKTGMGIRVRNIAVHWTNVGANVYGIAVYNKDGTMQSPFRCPRLSVELNFHSLLAGKIAIQSLVLDRPTVDFTVNRQGQTNLPATAPSKSASAAKAPSANPLFSLVVRHLAIHKGQIEFSDKEIPVSADLTGFGLQVRFDASAGNYDGFLRYENGRIFYGNFNPIENALQAQFTLNRSAFTIDPLRVAMENSRFTLDARLTNFSDPQIQGRYRIDLDTAQIARILKMPWLPAGEILTDGSLRYRNSAGPSFFQRVTVNGRISSAQLAVSAGRVNTAVTSVRGAYALENGNAQLTNVEAIVLGGALRLKSGVVDLTGNSSSHVKLTWQRVSLANLSAILLPQNSRQFHLVGRVDAAAQISWPKTISRMVVDSHLQVRGQAEQGAAGTIPFDGAINLIYNRARDSVSFRNSHLQLANTRLSLNGTVSTRSNLDVNLQAPNLHDFSELAAQLGTATKSSKMARVAALNLQGSAQFIARVFGSLQNPQLQGRLSAKNLQIEGTRWPSLAADIQLSPSKATITNGILVTAGRGQIRLNAAVGLQHWSFGVSSSPISAQLAATGVTISSLQRLFNLRYPISGTVSASFSVAGTGQHPSGHGTIRIVKVTAWNQPIESIAIDLRGAGQSLRSTAQVQTVAGNLNANLVYNFQTDRYQFAARSSGLQTARIPAIEQGAAGAQGTLVLAANGQGTFANPQLSANLSLSRLRLRGRTITNAQVKLDVANHEANFTSQMTVDKGAVQAKGAVALTGEYNATASLDVHALSLESVLAAYSKTNLPALSRTIDVHANLSGPLKNPSQLAFHVEIPALRLGYGGAQLALVSPLRLDYQNGIATLQRTELKGSGADFVLEGTIPVANQAPMNVAIDGTANLALLGAMSGSFNTSGRLTIHAAARGQISKPVMTGSIQISKAMVSTASAPVALSNVNGLIRLSGNRIEIASLKGNLGGGPMSVEGFAAYGKQTTFNLTAQGKSVGVPYPQGLLTLTNFDLHFAGSTANSLMSGRVVIDQIAAAKNLNVMSLASQISSGSATGPSSSSFESHTKLNVSLQTAQTISVSSSQLSVQGAANFTLTGTLANPIVLGRATLQRGDIYFFGRRYDIQGGTVSFSNPARDNPDINLYASTTVDQYNITMNFSGPLDRMRTTFTANPPLPPSDIITMLALGQAPGQSTSSVTNSPELGAESVLASGVAGHFTGKLQKLAGISQLSINPVIGSGQQSPGAQIAIQERVSGRLLFTFTTDTTATQNTAVELQYQVTPKVSVSGLRDQNGGYAIDVHIRKSF
jgi:translocation and assembly module TamB